MQWWPVRAVTRLWMWTLPGLIALEPAAMGFYVASGDMDRAPNAPAVSPTGMTRDVIELIPSLTVPRHLRAEGFGK